MKLGNWRRFAIYGSAAAALVAVAAACSDDDDATPTPAADSGADTGTADTGTTDAGTPDAPGTGTLVLNMVHAIPNLGNIKVCFEVAGAYSLNTPAPEGAVGLPPGAGGAVPVPAQFLPLLSTVDITPVIFPADGLAATATCTSVANGSAGVAQKDIYKLPPVKKGSLLLNKSFILALVGCKPGEGPTTAPFCGTSYDPNDAGPQFADGGEGNTGTLRPELIELDGVTGGAATLGFQFVHASPEAQFALGLNPLGGDTKVLAQIVVDGGAAEPDTRTDIGTAVAFADAPKATPTTAVRAAASVLSDPNANGIELRKADGGAFEQPIFLSWNTLTFTSTGNPDASATPGYFAKGNYAILAVGNPALPQTDPHTFRLIALPQALPGK